MITALLPMKGHSERVHNKNMRIFAGAPLFHRMASTLERSSLVSSIIINTDSSTIAGNALEHFNKVIITDRPKDLQGDLVSMNKIIAHDIGLCEGEHFLQTHSTSPLISLEGLEAAIRKYFEVIAEGYDSLFSVTRLQTRLYDRCGQPINHCADELLRTQDLAPVYEENSCLYLFSRTSFAASEKRIGSNPFLLEIPREEAWDIDEEMDFQVAEFLWSCRKNP
jgi:CMP-N-acetylneuraminic acid synthetase